MCSCLDPEPCHLRHEQDKLTCLLLSIDLWEYYLPYLYSCISFLGVLLPLGECQSLGEKEGILGYSEGGRRKIGGGLRREERSDM